MALKEFNYKMVPQFGIPRWWENWLGEFYGLANIPITGEASKYLRSQHGFFLGFTRPGYVKIAIENGHRNSGFTH